MSSKNEKKVDPCFLAWVHLLEVLDKQDVNDKEEKQKEE